MQALNFTELEAKWQKYWVDNKTYSVDLDHAEKPFYNLMMFPYPSAEGLHIGSMYTFTGVDTYGRFKAMQGYQVFEPIGLDAFGIHSENYALKIGEHVKKVSVRTHKHFFEQLRAMGNIFDWEHTVETNEPNYYKWTQWLFTQLFKSGLAYRKKASVKYCPSCKTVVSDEQVIDGKCERCSTEVANRDLEQWFFKITKYADRLSTNLDKIDWDTDVTTGQRNWIGKKKGINIAYDIKGSEEKIICFTTRPDTNFGATFIVLAPEHEFVNKIVNGELAADSDTVKAVKEYITVTKSKSDIERIAEGRKKTGVFTGYYAINNLNGKELPVYISDFVLSNFGTGAVVGVPGHDKRDFEFAKVFDLEVIRVVSVAGQTGPIETLEDVQEAEGVMVNSEFLNGMDIHKATEKIMDYMEEKGWGKKVISFNLRDWCVSRQRYWGPPIPMVFCQNCAAKGDSWFSTSPDAGKDMTEVEMEQQKKEMHGWYPEEVLPVLLPDIADVEQIKPDGSGRGPLAAQHDFVKTTCPHCKGEAQRETDVSDPFVDSCWYFLRYPFTDFDNIPFGGNFNNPKSQFEVSESVEAKKQTVSRMKKWGPVTSYIGGKEHTVLHLLYARFITMVMFDLGYIDFEEPFTRFFGHGLITKDGAKMSKSKGNVVNPDEYIAKFGADAIRLYLRFVGPFDATGDWRDTGMQGMSRFVNKLGNLYLNYTNSTEASNTSKSDLAILHKTIKGVGEDLDSLKFNTAVAKIMELVNWYTSEKAQLTRAEQKQVLENLALMLAPLAPHLAEEFWAILGNAPSVHKQMWPSYSADKLVQNTLAIPVQVNGKLRGTVSINKGAKQQVVDDLARKSERVAKYLTGMTIKRVIYIQDKIINYIVA